MDRSRAVVAVGFGILAVALAVAAVVTDEAYLVLLAAVAAVGSAAVASEAGWRRLFGRRSRAELEAATVRLDEERRKALERASKYEAEAIRARHDLATAMRARGSVGAGDEPEDRVEDQGPSDGDDEPVVDGGPAEAIDLTVPPPETQTDRLLDADTGMFSQLFYEASLEKRVSAARRGMRHLSIASVEVMTGVEDGRPRPADPKLVARTMTAVFRDADTIARADDGTFLLLFEDTPETGAVWTMERFRRRLADENPGHTTWVGISCYPAYGFTADQLLQQAHEALDRAREWRQDRIEITTASPD
ncbi:MAG: diguanylate cyclase [Actinobacteria bacterium]|nr:diguanylate cyclase [Actinomycetota bacterium]